MFLSIGKLNERESDAINQAIAEKLFGAEIVISPFSPVSFCEFKDETSHIVSVPKFSTEMGLAMLVRDEIAKMSTVRRTYFTDRLQLLISADKNMPTTLHLLHPAELILEVKPHHICIAALETIAQDYG